METIPVSLAFEDERGTITDLLNNVEIRHVGILTSRAGAIRGNHYHKKASQYSYVIKGRLEVVSQTPGQQPESETVSQGDMFLDLPGTSHAMRFLDDTELLVLTTVPRDEGGYEDDTVRLKKPLIS